jgi:serine/threonine protein kinase
MANMIRITLPNGIWQYEESALVGEAGMARVFQGTSATGQSVAIKRFHDNVADHAGRELALAETLIGQDMPHVIRIFDCGRDESIGGTYLVMELAEQDLANRIRTGIVTEEERLAIIDSIAAGLEELGPILLRDLKPSNILRVGSMWKVADVGIGRIADASTAKSTMKDWMTEPYASPEQFRGERATKKSDVYALGCIMFELFKMHPPFAGPDYQDQHLHATPPKAGAPAQIEALIQSALAKAPAARPDPSRIRKILSIAGPKPVPSPLATAGAAVAATKAEEDARRAKFAHQKTERARLAEAGINALSDAVETLFEAVVDEAVVVERKQSFVELGRGILRWDILWRNVDPKLFDGSEWDVVIGGYIVVEQRQPNYGRGSNLIYAKRSPDADYRLWEISLMNHPARSGNLIMGPFPTDIAEELAATLLHRGRFQLAATPVPIDFEDQQAFRDRWKSRLADAALGKLEPPRHLPEP